MVAQDAGVGYTFYLLTQVALASRTSDWETALVQHGIRLSSDSTVLSRMRCCVYNRAREYTINRLVTLLVTARLPPKKKPTCEVSINLFAPVI
jgi:hypothetical protein